MKRGDLVTVAVSGDYGKPRPALVVQSDLFSALPSVTVLRLASDIHAGHPIRITVRPEPTNGLRWISHVMIDSAVSVPRERIGTGIGHLDGSAMAEVGRALAGFFGLDTAGPDNRRERSPIGRFIPEMVCFFININSVKTKGYECS